MRSRELVALPCATPPRRLVHSPPRLHAAMASVGSLAPSRPSARRVARERRPPARRARRLPARASSASSGRATSDASDVVAVRYGLLNGSVAYYPRSDASSPSSPSARRRDTAPTTRYEDGPLDAAAMLRFFERGEEVARDDAPAAGLDRPLRRRAVEIDREGSGRAEALSPEASDDPREDVPGARGPERAVGEGAHPERLRAD